MLKILAPTSIAMTMALSGVAFAATATNSTSALMERPNVYKEAQSAAYAEPHPGTVDPSSTLRVNLYSESSQLARMPVNPDSVDPEKDLDISVYGFE